MKQENLSLSFQEEDPGKQELKSQFLELYNLTCSAKLILLGVCWIEQTTGKVQYNINQAVRISGRPV
jgi:hypothetical protein